MTYLSLQIGPQVAQEGRHALLLGRERVRHSYDRWSDKSNRALLGVRLEGGLSSGAYAGYGQPVGERHWSGCSLARRANLPSPVDWKTTDTDDDVEIDSSLSLFFAVHA